jgi:hypothetical protein
VTTERYNLGSISTSVGDGLMSEARTDFCGKCRAEIDSTRGVEFTRKDGTRVCESCFGKKPGGPGTIGPTEITRRCFGFH